MTEPFRFPAPSTGARHDVLTYGATPNNPADDDGAAFAQAIAAAKPGDEIFAPAGTYHVKKRRALALGKGLTLRGEGIGKTIIDAQFVKEPNSKGNPGSYLVEVVPGATDVRILDFSATSSGGEEPLRYAVWIGGEPPKVDDGLPVPPEDPARVLTERVEVARLEVTKFEKMGISVRNGKHVYIHDNVLKDATAVGGGGEGYGVMIGYPLSSNNWVSKNALVGPNIRHGVLLQYYAHHNLVEGNSATDLAMDAYDLHGEEEYSNELRHNKIVGCAEGGFGVGNTGGQPPHENAGPDNWIHHNEVEGCRYGIQIYMGSHKTYVEDNVFRKNDLGIIVKSSGGGGSDCRFLRNEVVDNAAGVRLEMAPRVLFQNNKVNRNTSYSMKIAPASTDFVIRGNDLSGNGEKAEVKGTGVFEGNVE